MAGDLQRFEDGGWRVSPPATGRRGAHGMSRGLTTLLFIFTLLLGQASLAALAEDAPDGTAATTTATDEPTTGVDGTTEDAEAGPEGDEPDEAATDDDSSTDEATGGANSKDVTSDEASTGSAVAASSGSGESAGSNPKADGSGTEASEPDRPGRPSGDGVQPVLVPGNPDCLDVLDADEFLFEEKQDPPADATIPLSYQDLSGTLTIQVNETNRTLSFSFSGDFVAVGVIVKGGSNANFYDYGASGNAADTRLHAPVNPQNGTFYGLSHLSFCIGPADSGGEGPGIIVEKTCPASIEAGTEIEYTITVENTGTETVVVTVDDSLLGDITEDFDVDLAAGLEVGASATAVVTYQPGPNEDPVTNTVTAQATGDVSGDTDTDTDTCRTDVTQGGAGAIDVTKSCPETVPAGGVVEYTITVENVGTEALLDVTVDDSLLGDITDEFDVDLSAGLGVGASATAVVTYRPDPNEDPVTNTVTVTATGAVSGDEETGIDGCETDVVTGEGPAIQVVKDGPTIAHRGDTITYEFTATNVGAVELFDVTLSDPRCDTGTIQSGAEVDASLAVGEVWTFTCTHLITQADPDPLPNTVTVRGDTVVGVGGQEVTDQDVHTLDIIQPAIRIVKTVSDDTVPIGTVVTYTYVVTNLGDTTLFNVRVVDNVLGAIDTIPSLSPGASVTLTAQFTVGSNPVTNVGTASGADVLGEVVTDTDTAFVSPIAGGGPGPGPGDGPGPNVGAGETPFTGFDARDWVLLAAVLAALGALSLIATRRNRGTA